MTDKQERLYWRTWGKARTALMAGGFTSAEAAGEREMITIDTLGANIPHRDFTNAQTDDMLDAFRRVAGEKAEGSGKRRRLLHGIDAIARTRPEYVADICRDIYGHSHWQRLEDTDLVKLRSTLARRVERRPA